MLEHHGPPLQRWHDDALVPVSSTPTTHWEEVRTGWISLLESILPQCYLVTGDVDPAALCRAVSLLAERHRILTARIVNLTETPCYRFTSQVLEPEYRELGDGITTEDELSGCLPMLQAFVWQPLDVNERLARALVLKLSSRKFAVCLVVHHLATDGESISVISRELPVLYYQALQPSAVAGLLPEPKLDYLDYLRSVDNWMSTQQARDQLRRYVHYLQGSQSGRLLSDFTAQDPQRPARSTCSLSREFPPEFLDLLVQTAQREAATAFLVLLTAQALLIWLDSAKTDFILSVVTANRQHPDSKSVVGFFVNALPIRLKVHETMTCAELLRATRSSWLEALEFEHIRFSDLERTIPDREMLVGCAYFNHYRHEFNSARLRPTPAAEPAATPVTWKPLAVPASTAALARSQPRQFSAHGLKLRDTLGKLRADVMYCASNYTEARMQRYLRDLEQSVRLLQAEPTQSLEQARRGYSAAAGLAV
jgi:hypothetical protein